MERRLEISFLALTAITLIGVSVSSWLVGTAISVLTVLILAVLKFLLVGFEFMELNKANAFWKFLFVFYSLLIGALMMLVLI